MKVLGRPVLAGLRTASVEGGAWEELEVCPLCGRADGWRDVSRIEGQCLGVVTSACLGCRFGFLRRRPTRAWAEEFYRSAWDQAGQRRAASLHPEAIEPDPGAYRFSTAHLKPASKILDVGAGFGSSLLAFQRAGHRVAAIEPSRHRAEFLDSRLGFPCVDSPARVEELAPPFDLICLQHVLEHLYDPVEALTALRPQLRPEGLLYLAVPNLWQEYFPQAFHFVPHLSWFTLASLQRLLAATGFEVVREHSGTELRVLARRAHAENPEAPALAAGEEFWTAVQRLVTDEVGGKSGRHLLVWYEDRESRELHYARRVLPGWIPAGDLIKGGIYLLTHSPGRVRGALVRWLPTWLRGHPRVLRVHLELEEEGLPLRLEYSGQRAPVWVK